MAIKTSNYRYRTNNLFRALKTAIVVVFVYLVVLTVYDHMCPRKKLTTLAQNAFSNIFYNTHKEIVDKYYVKRKFLVTSNLGKVLFRDYDMGSIETQKIYTVLVWKYWKWLQRRHLQGHKNHDPLDTCRVKNCIFTGDNKKLDSADAVLVHIQHGVVPNVTNRRPSQLWVFLTDESPHNTFSMGRPKWGLVSLANVFNWSMMYRSDADVPVPYGRTVPLKNPKPNAVPFYIPNWKHKQKVVLVVALMSNCVATRMNYIRDLQKHIKVDVIGKCSEVKKLSCPGSFKEDCPLINTYHFYLSFENSGCRQYLTEKVFYNAYSKGAIPIIMGPPVYDCERLLPPNSFLHVNNFASPRALAEKILSISSNEDTLYEYHEWRKNFQVLNEHGYFGTKSYHLCRLCEALNFNEKEPKVFDYEALQLYLEPRLLCSKRY